MSFCSVPPTSRHSAPLLFGHRQEEGEYHRGGRVDSHRGRHPVERDSVEEDFHVFARRNRDATFADLAFGKRMVGVVAHQRRQVEGRRKPGLPVFEQVFEAPVGVERRAVAGELPHRPGLRPIAGRMDAARAGGAPGKLMSRSKSMSSTSRGV